MGNYKLFVWENVLCDWDCGHVAVLASSVEHAREVAKRDLSLKGRADLSLILNLEPRIHEYPVAILCWGSA